VTVITAAITGAFLGRVERDQQASGDNAPSAEQLRHIDERLERIEAALNGRS
jgi:hypothetical protein